MLLYDDTVILDIIKHYLAHSYLRPDCPLSYVVNLVMDRYVRNPSLPKIMWEIMKIEDLENADLWKEWVADQESKATNFIEWSLRVYETEQMSWVKGCKGNITGDTAGWSAFEFQPRLSDSIRARV